MSLKTEIKGLFDKYEVAHKTFTETVDKWKNNDLYNRGVIDGYIKNATLEMEAADQAYNKTFMVTVQRYIDEITGKRADKAADFQLKVSNALSFINMMGDDITDVKAFELVRPFFGDYPTMTHFAGALSSKKDKVYVTFKAVNGYNTLLRYLKFIVSSTPFSYRLGTYETDMERALKLQMLNEKVDVFEKVLNFLNILYLADEGEEAAAIDAFYAATMGFSFDWGDEMYASNVPAYLKKWFE